MIDDTLPAAGWYADGVTPGVVRWFDGSDWTDQTLPAPATLPPAWATGVPSAGSSPFGTNVPSRLGLGRSAADDEARDAALARHRYNDARRVRRGAIGWFCSSVALLAVTGAASLALGGPGDLWILGAIGGVFCVGRAIRDYHRAVFRGAPSFSVPGFALAIVALIAAVGIFVASPVQAAHQVSDLTHDLDGPGGIDEILHQVGGSP